MSANAVATVLGGFWAQFSPTLTQISGDAPQKHKIAQLLGKKSLLDLRARMTALDGVAPGANATKNYTVVQANVELGGLRAIDTQVLINRNTTAADVTEIETDVNTYSTNTTFGANPPVNLDGNPLGTR